MPEKVATRNEAETHYRDLVRLAYFVQPGRARRVYRMAVARRIVDEAVTRRPRGDLARQRTRVLRRAMRPSRRLRIGLGPWLRALPARLPDAALTAALADLEPPVRVAWVLRRIEGMRRYAVRDQLLRLRVRDPWPVIDAADAAELPALEPPDAFAFGPGMDHPVRRRPLIPVAAAVALTAALGGALVITENEGSLAGGEGAADDRRLHLLTAAPGAWRGGPHRLDVWPARGDLAGDRGFTTRALRAWARSPAAPRPPGRGDVGAQLLFAGHVDGVPTALLRNGDRVARYSGQGRPVEIFTAAADDGSTPLPLGGGRYLLAPWDTRAATPGGRKVEVDAGVTERVPAPKTPCGRGPLLRLEGADGARTVGDLGFARPAVLTQRPAEPAPDARRPAPDARSAKAASGARAAAPLTADGVRLWERVACALPRLERSVTEASARRFWTGTLPHGGGPAEWVCTSLSFTTGGPAGEATLLRRGAHHATGSCDVARPVSGTWWQAPSGRWYYLAAAGPGLVPHIQSEGALRTADTRGRLLVASSLRSAHQSGVPITLTARAR
ncbi:hypothetical protein Acsp04_26320 [Actinomadura sp. NBRC 104425]|nr:hypothetical protein Acsp04_26320 [Actinomadura sp. NBRC 104425]